jgi:hypothetical protein
MVGALLGGINNNQQPAIEHGGLLILFIVNTFIRVRSTTSMCY